MTDEAPPSVASTSDLLSWRASATPDDVLVRCGPAVARAGQLDQAVTRVARGLLGLGLRPGDRVGVLLANSMEFVETIFACSRAGLVQVPLNAYLKGDFLRHQLVDSGARAVVTDDEGAQAVGALHLAGLERVIRVGVEYPELAAAGSDVELPDVSPQGLAALQYTSGTTGLPKACMLSHAYQLRVAQAYYQAGWVSQGERVFTALPLFHAGGQLAALMTAILAGGRITFPAAFSASRFMAQAAADEASLVFGVMAMASAILASDPAQDPPKGSIGKAIWIPMPAPAQRDFSDRFGCEVTAEGYGQSEATAICLNPFDAAERRPGTLGRPTSIVDMIVVDENDVEVADGEIGEMVIRPRVPGAIFSGYWGKPEETLAAFRNLWYHTGDYGRRDPDGFFWFADRKKDSIRRRGENVSSVELEQAILAHPGIAEVAVHAVPAELGEDDIKACVVAGHATTPELDELFDFLKQRLPYFAIPRYVEYRSALPKNGVGRVLKHQLRAEGVTENTHDLQAIGLTVAADQRRGTTHGN